MPSWARWVVAGVGLVAVVIIAIILAIMAGR
jgi:hypothetical protein